MKARVLIVDDEPRMGSALAIALRRSGHACQAVTSGADALKLFEEQGADVVITDRRMPGMSGDELLRRLKEKAPELPVILITAFGDVRSAVAAMREGAFDYVTKPFDNDELRGLVARALELQHLRRENRLLRREVADRFTTDIVAESPAMQAVLELVDRAAPSNAAVLIQGESGTGKEVIAKRLHFSQALEGESSRPFVAVNCKAFSPGVLESELFGHEKGAFTGAETQRPGCFERADGGTLFLDEIGETETDFQAKLLRVLQEGEVLRVGGDEPRRIDVRVVAATNRDLRAAVIDGRFREDLFYRLNVIPVQLPPLRQRREDILPLARHFLARSVQHSGRHIDLSDEAETRLLEHSWPGNVRELENAIERATILARGDAIEPEDLLLEESTARPAATPMSQGNLQEYLDACTAERIQTALEATGGRRAEAARELGIDRTTLFRLMRRLEF